MAGADDPRPAPRGGPPRHWRPSGRPWVRGGRPGRASASHWRAPLRWRPTPSPLGCAPHLRRRAPTRTDPARGPRRASPRSRGAARGPARHRPCRRPPARRRVGRGGLRRWTRCAPRRSTSGASSSTCSRAGSAVLLERLGEPARPDASEALAALTTAEARVATLAAGGLTNREIAGQLIVTVKAVEWHPLPRLPQARHPLALRPPRASVSPDCSTRGHGRPAGESARLALRSPESAGLARHPGPSRRILPSVGRRVGASRPAPGHVGQTWTPRSADRPGGTRRSMSRAPHPASGYSACPAGTTRRLDPPRRAERADSTLPGGQDAPTRPPREHNAPSRRGQSQRNHRPCPCASATARPSTPRTKPRTSSATARRSGCRCRCR